MVDAEDLVFAQYLVDLGVQRLGAVEIDTERLFDDDVDPGALGSLRHAVLAEALGDIGEVLGRDSEVEEPVALGAELLVEIGEEALELFKARIVVEVGRKVPHTIHERLQLGVAGVNAAALENAILHVRGKGGGQIAARYAHDREVLGEQTLLLQVVQRRQQLALGQVARGAENHHNAWVWHTFVRGQLACHVLIRH